jgi:hypothetical protein
LVFPLWSGKVGASECICVYEMGKHPWSLPEWVRMDILNCVLELCQTEILWVKVTLLAKLQIMVCWYSCSMFILLQYSFVFFVENRWGSLPKSFRSNYKNTRSGRRKLCALLLCRKSRSLPLDVPCDSLCSTGNHVPSHCQLQNMAPQYASSLQMNSLQYWHLPPALPSPANATQPMKPCPITVACNSWKVRTHFGQYRIWLVHCSFN